MTDTKKSLRRALNYVANTTRSTDRLAEIKGSTEVSLLRRPPGWVMGLASFAAVILIAAIPILIANMSAEQDVLGSPPSVPAPVASTTTVAPNVAPSIESTVQASLGVDGAWCLYSDTGTPGVSGFVTDYVDEGPVDETVYRSWCESYGDGDAPPEFTVCRGVFAPEVYEHDIFAERDKLIAGVLDDDRPGFPVVLAWDAECETEELKTSPSVILDSTLSYEEIDRFREIELELRQLTDDQCLSESAALDQAVETWTRLGDGWLLFREEVDSPPECYGVTVDVLFGIVFLVPAE